MTPSVFFEEQLPRLLGDTVEEHFHRCCEEEIAISFLISGDEGLGAGRWTFGMSSRGLIVSAGEGDLIPLMTICTPLEDWPETRPRIELWLGRLSLRLSAWTRKPWDRTKLKKFSSFSGTIRLTASGHLDDRGGERDLVAEVFLNSYTREGEQGFGVELDSSDYDAILQGRLGPLKAFADGVFRFSGELGLGMRLMIAVR